MRRMIRCCSMVDKANPRSYTCAYAICICNYSMGSIMTEHTAQPTQLAPWETWPIWALGLSNGLNLAIWYVVSMLAIQAPGLLLRLPGFVNALLPLLIVAGAVATAISLDG